MDPFWIAVLSAGTSSVVTVVIQPFAKYLFKYSLRHEYDVRLEELKGRIRGESEAAIANLQAEHQRLLTEHKIRFSALHAEQAKVISQVYGAILQAEEDLADAFSPARSVDPQKKIDKLKKASESYESFSRLAMSSRIYFSKPLCERFDDLRNVAQGAYTLFTTWMPVPEGQRDTKDIIADRQNQYNAHQEITGKFALMRELLEDEFRAILGSDGGEH
jgi:hypothetical protein